MASQMPQTDLIRDLVESVKADQSAPQRKANTVTVTIGSILTGLAATGTYFLESDLGLPGWAVLIVLVIGSLGTILGTSQTKNGVTDSIADKLELELSRRIDAAHYHGDDVGGDMSDEGDDDISADVLRGHADQLADDAARHESG